MLQQVLRSARTLLDADRAGLRLTDQLGGSQLVPAVPDSQPGRCCVALTSASRLGWSSPEPELVRPIGR
jgi:hypothetical protein